MIEHDSSNQNQENTDIKETVTSVTRLFLECTGNEKSYILCVCSLSYWCVQASGLTYHSNVPVHSEYPLIGADLMKLRSYQFLYTKYNSILTTNSYGRPTQVRWEWWDGI